MSSIKNLTAHVQQLRLAVKLKRHTVGRYEDTVTHKEIQMDRFAADAAAAAKKDDGARMRFL